MHWGYTVILIELESRWWFASTAFPLLAVRNSLLNLLPRPLKIKLILRTGNFWPHGQRVLGLCPSAKLAGHRPPQRFHTD